MSTQYEVVYQAYKANTWGRTDFRFAGITEAAQFCATTGNRPFIVVMENDCQRSLDEEEIRAAPDRQNITSKEVR